MTPRTPITPTPRRAAARRGSVYVLVLGASVMVTAAGLSAVAIARAGVRATAADRDAAEAATAARAGLEMLLAQINSTPTWRTACTSGAGIGPVTIGRAKVMLVVTDETDGNLPNDASQSVRLYAAAQVGTSVRSMSVQASPAVPVGYDALRCAIHAAGNITVNKNTPVSGGPLSTNAHLSNVETLTGDVEAASVSSAGFIAGKITTPAPAKTMPDDAGWTALSALATTIPFASINSSAIDKKVLTPGVNQVAGATNARGIYAVNVPALSKLTIKFSRLQATLLVTLGASAELKLEGENVWEPGGAGLPTLLVKGALLSKVTLDTSPKAALIETDAGQSLNPAGAPYAGVSDADTLDSYPNQLSGLVHITGGIPCTLENDFTFVGCLITDGTVTLKDHLEITATPSLLSTPPVGYADPSKTGMALVPGTYRWEVSP